MYVAAPPIRSACVQKEHMCLSIHVFGGRKKMASIYPRDISHALAATKSVGTVRTVYMSVRAGQSETSNPSHSGLGLLDVT